MQKLFRRRKAQQTLQHLKHLDANPRDIPVVHARAFKWSRLQRQLSEEKILDALDQQGSPSHAQRKQWTQAQMRKRELLLHKCVSGDVEYVREELSVYSVHMTEMELDTDSGQFETEASSDKAEQYIDDEILKCVMGIASQDGHLSIVKWLVSTLHFDPQTPLEPRRQSTALHYAAENGRSAVVAFLVATTPAKAHAIMDARLRVAVDLVHDQLKPELYVAVVSKKLSSHVNNECTDFDFDSNADAGAVSAR